MHPEWIRGKKCGEARGQLFLLSFFLFISAVAHSILAESASLPPLPTGRYDIAPEKSRMTVFVRSTLHDFDTIISKFTGSLALPENGESASVRFHLEFPTAELDTGIFLRNGAMRSQALHVEKYPKAEFDAQSANFIRQKGREWEYRITGMLSIHGVKREITVPVTAWVEGKTLNADTKFPFLLSAHKIIPPGLLFIKTEDKVDVKIRFSFQRK